MKAINKTLLITLGLALTLGLSACTGCSSNGWSTSASSSSSGSSETTYEIKWFNYGNILLYSEQVREGELPVYRGNTPTRPETAKSIFTFEGWAPEIVPATQDATYKAVYSSVTKTYTVTFAGGNCTCEYSQTVIENVPYGSKINVIGNRSIEINGTTVTVELTPTPSEQIIYQYSYDGWNVEDGDLVKEDMTISAVFKTSSTLYNIRLMASGGGELYATYNGYDTYSGSDIFIPNAKAYVGYIAGQPIGEPVPAGNIALETVVNGIVKYLVVEPRTTSSEFYHYVIDGWYYNGEPLRYGVELYGDVMIEARFKEEPNNDYAQYFEFEINTMTNDATIIGAKDRVQYCDFEDLIIPKTYEGYRITGIKSDVLTQFRYSNCLYIPNTLMYVEEGTQESTYIYPRFSAPNKIVVEDGSTSFRMIEGVLYDYEITTVFAGTIEMTEYLEQKGNHLHIPETVTTICKYAFNYIPIQSVDLPNGLTTIPYKAFNGCGLEFLTIPETVTTIEDQAFCAGTFDKLIIPNAVTYIGSLAFGANDNLKKVSLGSGLYGFNYDAFYNCHNIESFTVSSNNQHLSSYNGMVYDKQMTTLKRCPSGLKDDPKDIFASTLKSIGAYAFEYCQFETLHLPEGLTGILNMGVYYCPNLTSVYLPSTLTALNCASFGECYSVTYMEYNGTKEQWGRIYKEGAPRNWDKGLDNLTEIVCLDGTVSIK